ncbi:MAG: hypothetical protein MJZ60_01740 [Bacteroidaceae bacterium]|nr:hypothetical protein [Bacteroidaceae bacterium]
MKKKYIKPSSVMRSLSPHPYLLNSSDIPVGGNASIYDVKEEADIDAPDGWNWED